MKRFTLSVFLLSAINLLCSAQIKGDMNDDNVLDITDVTMLIQKILTPDIILECPDDNHPHQIDLGLPSGTKWACCNVGATTPEDYGGYYSWGETEAKSDYMWTAYSHCDGTYETCHDLGSDIAGTQYDVAHVKWGGSWKMPTLDQINELNDNCTWLWTSKNNINGYKVTGTNGRTIFLPAAGYRYDSDLYAHGTYGYYWSSTQYTDSDDSAYYLGLGSDSHDCYDGSRNEGQCVRPVIVQECPDDNHPHAIDLGLPSGTKWACCNVGATTPEGCGGYYSWGETEAKNEYMWTTYSHCDGTYETCHDLGSDIAGTQYDVAHVKWGGSWKMPTLDQINELNDNCTWLWTSKNNINGYKVTGTNGRTIFLPAAGYRYDSDLYAHGTYGYYWSSSQYTDSYDSAYYLDLGSESHDYYDGSRNDGQCVRPVIEQ